MSPGRQAAGRAAFAPGAPLPRALAGALLGRIGSGQPFAIGNLTSVVMPADGELFLGVNDDGLNDNSGQFTVTVTAAARANRR